MEFNQLQYFKQIVQTSNITQAAKELYISQPALSMSLKKLEQELGVTLFLRDRGKMVLTEDGQKLLKHADNVLEEMSYIQTGLFHRSTNQPLKLLSCDSPSLRYFSAAILQAHQSLALHTVLSDSKDALSSLLAGEADIVFTAEPIESKGISCSYLCEATMSVSVAPSHELYDRARLTWDDLDGKTFLVPSGTSFLLTRISQVEGEKGLHFERVRQNDSALFFQMSRHTNHLYFDSTLDHLLPRNPRRKNLAVSNPSICIRYYGSCLESESERLEPFIASIQRFYWVYENEQRLVSPAR